MRIVYAHSVSAFYNEPLLSLEYHRKLNVIDCPGADDFVGSAITALNVTDTGVIVIDSQYGVEVDTNLSLYRSAVRRLADFLDSIGLSGLLITEKNVRWLNTELYDSDYNRFLAGDVRAINEFQGEYMTDYSWGESTLGRLCRMKDEK